VVGVIKSLEDKMDAKIVILIFKSHAASRQVVVLLHEALIQTLCTPSLRHGMPRRRYDALSRKLLSALCGVLSVVRPPNFVLVTENKLILK